MISPRNVIEKIRTVHYEVSIHYDGIYSRLHADTVTITMTFSFGHRCSFYSRPFRRPRDPIHNEF